MDEFRVPYSVRQGMDVSCAILSETVYGCVSCDI